MSQSYEADASLALRLPMRYPAACRVGLLRDNCKSATFGLVDTGYLNLPTTRNKGCISKFALYAACVICNRIFSISNGIGSLNHVQDSGDICSRFPLSDLTDST
ncbi:unnamed protein product [Dicrocoelium dendriticum]|nr:unnamed protein product [Dicrocoelium dendriticum]